VAAACNCQDGLWAKQKSNEETVLLLAWILNTEASRNKWSEQVTHDGMVQSISMCNAWCWLSSLCLHLASVFKILWCLWQKLNEDAVLLLTWTLNAEAPRNKWSEQVTYDGIVQSIAMCNAWCWLSSLCLHLASVFKILWCLWQKLSEDAVLLLTWIFNTGGAPNKWSERVTNDGIVQSIAMCNAWCWLLSLCLQLASVPQILWCLW